MKIDSSFFFCWSHRLSLTKAGNVFFRSRSSSLRSRAISFCWARLISTSFRRRAMSRIILRVSGWIQGSGDLRFSKIKIRSWSTWIFWEIMIRSRSPQNQKSRSQKSLNDQKMIMIRYHLKTKNHDHKSHKMITKRPWSDKFLITKIKIMRTLTECVCPGCFVAQTPKHATAPGDHRAGRSPVQVPPFAYSAEKGEKWENILTMIESQTSVHTI